MVKERAFWVAWSTISGIGPILLKRLHRHFGSLALAWEASLEDLTAVEGVGIQTAELIVTERRRIQPADLFAQHEQDNPNFWTPADAAYPRLLAETPDPPPVLYYRGNANGQELISPTPTVAIVGTRSPSEYGRKWTRRITTLLVEQGFTIISGLAEGIDTEAHRSCLAAGGQTIAVVGSGVDVIYPWSNRGLYQQILESGLVMSEHPAGTQPDRAFFPRRNRIIAGLSRAILVMEAPARSGALITAHYANDYGRDVYVLPGSLDNPNAIGCLKLINKGAQVILEDELLDMLGMLPQLDQADWNAPKQTTLPLNLNLSPEMEQLLQAIAAVTQATGTESVSLDQLVQQTGLGAGALLSTLTNLEMAELVIQLPGMRYQRS